MSTARHSYETAPAAAAVAAPAQHGGGAAAVLRAFAGLASGEVAARFIAFGTTVYLARTLGASGYGILGFAAAVMLYLARVADFGMEFFGLGVREIAEDHARVETVAPALLGMRLLISGAIVLALAALVPVLPRPDGAVLALYGLTMLAVGGGTRWIHIGLQRTRLVALSRTMGELAVLALVLSLVHGRADLARAPLAQFAGDALAAFLLFAALRRWGYHVPIRFDWSVVRPTVLRALPLVGSALLGLVIYNSDLILLRFFRDTASVGWYAAGYLLVSFLLNLGGAYSQSLTPALTRSWERTRLYHTSALQVALLSVPLAVGASFVAGQVVGTVFGARYAPAGTALAILIWSIPFSLAREVATAALVVGGGQRLVFRLTAWSAVFNLALNFALIPHWGLRGAALATVITEVVRASASLYEARTVGYPLPPLRILWRPAAAAAAMAALLVALPGMHLWLAVPAGAAAYAVALLALGYRPALR